MASSLPSRLWVTEYRGTAVRQEVLHPGAVDQARPNTRPVEEARSQRGTVARRADRPDLPVACQLPHPRREVADEYVPAAFDVAFVPLGLLADVEDLRRMSRPHLSA